MTTSSESRKPAIIVALDIGTSSTRAILFDQNGHKVGDAAQQHYEQTTTPDGGVEVDADYLLELTARCIDEVLGASPAAPVAVAASCFWHSLMAVDAQGRPLTPLFSWADNRAAPWIGPLRATLDEEETHERTGCVFHTSYWPAKLLWLHHTRAELFVEGTRWISFGEYICQQLFGHSVCSLSMASGTGLFNQNNCDWDEETLAALPISRESLSPLCDVNQAMEEIVGPLREDWLKRWPALQDAHWYPAVGDGACSNIGSGCIDAHSIALNVGTSAALRVVLREYSGAAPRGLWRYRIDRNRSLMGGALSNGGSVFSWVRETFRLPDDIENQLCAMKPDAHGLTVLPFLAGERSPLWNAEARLTIEGANLDTSPPEILRACLEGASLRFAAVARLVQDAMEEHGAQQSDFKIVASGGALSKSSCWTQITCDCLGAPLVESREAEASARGAALLALEACGIINDIADLPAELGRVVQPDADHHKTYEKSLSRQNSLYEKLYGDAHGSKA